jgi:hypothetical protein
MSDHHFMLAVRKSLGLNPTKNALGPLVGVKCRKDNVEFSHALVCRSCKENGMQRVHNHACHVIYECCRVAGVPAQKEVLVRTVAARVPLHAKHQPARGQPDPPLPGPKDQRRYDVVVETDDEVMAIDFSVVQADSDSAAKMSAKAALDKRAHQKLDKYQGRVLPIIMSSSGGMHPDSREMLAKLADAYENTLDDPTAQDVADFKSRFKQQLAIALQRFQAIVTEACLRNGTIKRIKRLPVVA